MPPKALPREEDIIQLSRILVAKGFSPIQGLEHFRKATKEERVVPPRPREGAELGFLFQRNDLAVVVWTSWLLHDKKAREKDRGWVVIEQRERGVYFLPINRTKYFIDRLIMEASIARFRVLRRPICKRCQTPMRIVHGNGLGSRFWRCPYHYRHSASWDSPFFERDLPLEAKQHITKRRRRREVQYEKCREAGKPIRQAMLRRIGWRRVTLPPSAF